MLKSLSPIVRCWKFIYAPFVIQLKWHSKSYLLRIRNHVRGNSPPIPDFSHYILKLSASSPTLCPSHELFILSNFCVQLFAHLLYQLCCRSSPFLLPAYHTVLKICYTNSLLKLGLACLTLFTLYFSPIRTVVGQLSTKLARREEEGEQWLQKLQWYSKTDLNGILVVVGSRQMWSADLVAGI